jgi:capsular polysaccharide export protein
VDQTLGDASIGYGLASTQSFSDMIAAARRDEPDAQLIVKRHPASPRAANRAASPRPT